MQEAVEILNKLILDAINTKRKDVVYFLQRPTDGAIKIGWTGRIRGRMRELEKEHGKLTLLGCIRGGRDIEKRLHWLFSKSNISGEWYAASEELDLLIKSTPKVNPYMFDLGG